MGIMDKIKAAVSKDPAKANMAIDKAGGMAKVRTKGKYGKQIDTATTQAKRRVKTLDSTNAPRGRRGTR